MITHAFLLDGLHRIVKYEGVQGLFKGTIMSIIGVSNGAIQFMAYEELKKQARRRRVRKYGPSDGPVDLVSCMSDPSVMTALYADSHPAFYPAHSEQYRIRGLFWPCERHRCHDNISLPGCPDEVAGMQTQQ